MTATRFTVTDAGVIDTLTGVNEFAIGDREGWERLAHNMNKATKLLGYDAPIAKVAELSQSDEIMFGEE